VPTDPISNRDARILKPPGLPADSTNEAVACERGPLEGLRRPIHLSPRASKEGKNMNKISSTLALLIAGVLILSLSSPLVAWAEEPGPAALEPPAADAPQIERFEYWRARGDAAIARLQQAEAERDEAQAAVSRMRRRNHPRGVRRQELQAELVKAQEAYEAARHHLEIDLPAEARRSGAPRHWVGKRS